MCTDHILIMMMLRKLQLLLAQGDFDLKGALPVVPDNVELVPGLYNESLPVFLKQQDAAAPSGRMPDISYLHVSGGLLSATVCVLPLRLLLRHCSNPADMHNERAP